MTIPPLFSGLNIGNTPMSPMFCQRCAENSQHSDYDVAPARNTTTISSGTESRPNARAPSFAQSARASSLKPAIRSAEISAALSSFSSKENCNQGQRSPQYSNVFASKSSHQNGGLIMCHSIWSCSRILVCRSALSGWNNQYLGRRYEDGIDGVLDERR